MDLRKLGVGAVLALIAVAGVGYAYVEGIGPLGEDPAAGLEDPPETEKDYEMGSSGTGGVGDGGESETRTGPPFGFEVESVDSCGRTCREVDSALHNRMREEADEVVVYTRIYAGNTTDSDAIVWADNRDVPTVEPGGVYRSTDTVELSPQQAEKVRERDGRVTVEATVEGSVETVRFSSREDAS